jgi:hypothetical protein
MRKIDKTIVHFALGQGTDFARAENKVKTWAELREILGSPVRTNETRNRYEKMGDAQQIKLKSVSGWISGAPCKGGRRKNDNIMPRDLITLDIDYATQETVDKIVAGETGLSEYEFYCHSTRRHTSEFPRLRIFLPMTNTVDRQAFSPVARIASWLLENEPEVMMWTDRVSARSAQMMFLPTLCADGEWFEFHNEGKLLDPEVLLEGFEERVGDWRDIDNWPLYNAEKKLRIRSEKAEDPKLKTGFVGAFCRAYDVEAAMKRFLPGVYEETSEESGKTRYSYVGATTTNGAVVEDDGDFLYSHHSSDPVGEQLVNAFDLVRIHLFGDLDENVSEDAKLWDWPSMKAMRLHVSVDQKVMAKLAEQKYDVTAMFEDLTTESRVGLDLDDADDLDLDEDEEEDAFDDDDPFLDPEIAEIVGVPVSKPRPKKPVKTAMVAHDTSWFSEQLEFDHAGNIKSTLHNVAVLIENDPRLKGAVAQNLLRQSKVLRRTVATKSEIASDMLCYDLNNGTPWQDIHTDIIRCLLDSPNGKDKKGYGLKCSLMDIQAALNIVAERNAYHPVHEYLEGLKWDGVRRVKTMFSRYLGCDETAYSCDVGVKIMLASVVRVYEPGCKFDFAPIIEGAQGIRKSTFIKVLYSDDYFGELDCDLGDRQKIAETILGKWCLEMPEMTSLHKSDLNEAKAFLRRQKDDTRLSYRREVKFLPRQSVNWGTTNDRIYLKDPTGNRSFWPLDATRKSKLDPIDTEALEAERDQLWAETYHDYIELRKAQPHGTLDLSLVPEAWPEALLRQEAARGEELHEDWAFTIITWFNEPIRLSELYTQYGMNTEAMMDLPDGRNPENMMVRRNVMRKADVMEFALEMPGTVRQFAQKTTLNKAMSLLDDTLESEMSRKRWFDQKSTRWHVRRNLTPEDLNQGWSYICTVDELDPTTGQKKVDLS